MRVFIKLCLLLASFQVGLAQTENTDSVRLENALDKAFYAKNLDSAALYFRQAEKEMKTPFWRAHYFNALAIWLYNTGHRDSAKYHLRNLIENIEAGEQSDRYYIEISYACNGLSLIDLEKLGREGANELKMIGIELLESRNIKNSITASHILDIGLNHWYMEHYSIAMDWFEKGMKFAQENNYESRIMDASGHLAMGYQHQRKLGLALEYYKLHITHIKKDLEWNGAGYVMDLKSIGLIYSEAGKLDSAQYYFEEGLRFIEAGNLENGRPGEGAFMRNIILNNLANVQMRQKKYTAAEASFLEVLDWNKRFYGEEDPHLIRIVRGLGDLYRRTKEFDRCEAQYQEALRLAKINNYEVHSCLNRLGLLYEIMKDYDNSLAYYDSSIMVNRKIYNDDQMAFIYPVYMLNSLMGKAKIENSMTDIDVQNLEAIYLELSEVITFIQKNSDSQAIFEYIPKVLGYLYEAYSKIYDKTGDEQWLNRLWEISELNKASKLRDQLKDNYSLTFALPEQLLKRQKSLKDSINLIISQLKPGGFDSTLFMLRRKYERFIKEVEKRYPKYHALKNSNDFISLSVKQAQLKTNELLYNFLEGDSSIFVMQVGPDSFKTTKIDRALLLKHIDNHNLAIFDAMDDLLKEASDWITSAMLLDPEDMQYADRLIIVPDGLVWNLNFAALLQKDQDGTEFLGNRYTIGFDHFSSQSDFFLENPSLEVLAFSFNEESDAKLTTKRTALRDLDVSLPGTSLEVSSISKLWKGDYFYAGNANETAFKNEVGKYGILHLAVHGYQDEEAPENSYLKFAEADSINDGRLHAYEVYNLDLNADLAVLSACHSGQGTVVAGEGMVSLGRAFVYAGVKCVLISRWEVSDYAAPFMMKYFYTALKKGMRKSEALKFAQKKYLKNHSDEVTSSPYYWSSFYVLGDDNPIYQPAEVSPWLVLWAALILLSTRLFAGRKQDIRS